jgi:hypothetical protein
MVSAMDASKTARNAAPRHARPRRPRPTQGCLQVSNCSGMPTHYFGDRYIVNRYIGRRAS